MLKNGFYRLCQPQAVRGDGTLRRKHLHPGGLRSPQRVRKGGVYFPVGGKLAGACKLQHKQYRRAIARLHGTGKLAKVFDAAFGGRVREQRRAVLLLRDALHLHKALLFPGLYQ